MTADDAEAVDLQAARAGTSRLEDGVNCDELTGHFNRPRLREVVDRAIAAAMRRPDPAAFLVAGIGKYGQDQRDLRPRRCRHGAGRGRRPPRRCRRPGRFESQLLLRNLLGLAEVFGFSTIAEGVETEWGYEASPWRE